MKNDNLADALDQPFAVLANRTASSLALRTAAEQARGAVRAFDEAHTSAPHRRAQILSNMKPPLTNTVAALAALDEEGRTRERHREIAIAIAAQLDARALDAEKAEIARDEARKPFHEQTRRAHELAKRLAEYPTIAERVVQLFCTDVAIRKFSGNAYSRVPRPQGSHIGYERTISLPRLIATPAVLAATCLPCVQNGEWTRNFWPARHQDYSWIVHAADELSDDGIVSPLRQLARGAPADSDVAFAIAKADAVLVAEFGKAIAAIHELVSLDGTISAEDLAAKYPDGGAIFDPSLFQNWKPRWMRNWIRLPSPRPVGRSDAA